MLTVLLLSLLFLFVCVRTCKVREVCHISKLSSNDLLPTLIDSMKTEMYEEVVRGRLISFLLSLFCR